MALFTSALILATALMAAPAEQVFDQAQTPPAQGQSTPPQAQAPPATAAPAGQEPKQAKPEEKRQSKRAPRPARPGPTSSGQGTFDQGRQSRDGGRTRQELTFTANVLGGYDDNLTAGVGSGPGTAPDAMVSGATASVDGTLSYFRGNNLRSFRLDTSGSLVGYPDNLEDPAPGGRVFADIRTPLGSSLTLGLSERVSYLPLFNVLSEGAGTGPLPPGVAQPAPTTGLYERDSWSSSTGLSLEQRFGRRDTATLGYSYQAQEFTDDGYGDNTWHEVAAGYRHIVSAQVKAGPDYRYRSGEYDDSTDSVRPTTDHRIEGVVEFIGAPSRRRSFSLLLAVGAGYLESVNASGNTYASWMPIGRANVTANLSAGWSVTGGYQRDLSLLQGVTDDVYKSDTAFVSTNAMLTPRLALTVGATYSNWVTPVASGTNDTMDVYGASVGFRVLLAKSLAATAGYNYYLHRYSNPASLPEGFPAEYDRQAVRVGVTFYFPLAGTASAPPSRW